VSKSRKAMQTADDIDLATLGSALWRARGWILGLTLLAGAVTFIGLSMVRPLYTSEACILIQNDESVFTRPTTDREPEPRTSLDEQAVQSQVQVLTSRDLILQVVTDLDLTQNAAFAKDEAQTWLKRLLNRFDFGRGSLESEEERAANTVAEHLDVLQLSKSSVIAVKYTSGDPQLAAEVANKLADVYIGWQRNAKIEQTKDDTAWLKDQIEVLRKRTVSAEEAVEKFRSSEGLYAGSSNLALNAQQLSELNSQLILAEAQKSEAEAPAAEPEMPAAEPKPAAAPDKGIGMPQPFEPAPTIAATGLLDRLRQEFSEALPTLPRAKSASARDSSAASAAPVPKRTASQRQKA
jgi:uncharacterized protein involved in exopolysaccharide biosynthesis